MMRVNRNLYPPGGYFFNESDGTELRAGNWKGLFARIVKYRQENRLPIGNPEAEAQVQCCQRNPAGCWDDSHRPTYPASRADFNRNRQPSLKTRVMKWLGELVKRSSPAPLPRVSRELAKSRMAICQGCPKKSKIGGGCAPCAQALKSLRRQALGKDPDGADIGGCSVLGEDIATAVCLDEVTIPNKELPGNCWRSRTL